MCLIRKHAYLQRLAAKTDHTHHSDSPPLPIAAPLTPVPLGLTATLNTRFSETRCH